MIRLSSLFILCLVFILISSFNTSFRRRTVLDTFLSFRVLYSFNFIGFLCSKYIFKRFMYILYIFRRFFLNHKNVSIHCIRGIILLQKGPWSSVTMSSLYSVTGRPQGYYLYSEHVIYLFVFSLK